ncbi:unnamed protein product [Alternaria alternata]|uniref:uncharacterized protein n=1 Tax=Alternaria postmessia TaxID=1187938 RepID=UPI00222401E9|nr:uncharacterized protein J4E82_001047 [Alternaria postmessia]KAI5379975.1 hypothetical protein J4E82_001047 [Alternaria postmessia]
MSCAASTTCGASSCATSAPALSGFGQNHPAPKLTEEQKEALKKKQEVREEKKRQEREIRYKAWADTKAKLSDATSKKAKLRDSGIYSITADSGTTYYGSTPEEVAERERQEKKQQRREARAEVANTIKAKRNETTKKSEKIRLAVTWLTLKLHL